MNHRHAGDRDPFAALEAAMSASAIAGIVRAMQHQAARAWTQSRLGRMLVAAGTAHARHGTAAALRLAGLMLLACTATHLALLTQVPPQVAPGLPWAVWAAVAAAGLVLVVVPADLAIAWRARRSRADRDPR